LTQQPQLHYCFIVYVWGGGGAVRMLIEGGEGGAGSLFNAGVEVLDLLGLASGIDNEGVCW
jgi:hypothetical protein